MIKEHGIVKTSQYTKVSRVSLWRWKTNGVNPKKRVYESKLFHNVKDIITLFLVTTKCTNAKEIMMFLRNNNKLIISTKMIYKFIKKRFTLLSTVEARAKNIGLPGACVCNVAR